jgi:SP family general alpha glucoside:H+ symporter-like MFS transporter
MATDEKEKEVVFSQDVKPGQGARDATDAEHKMTLREAIKLYPTAIGWAMFFSLGTIMTAFDPQLLGNLYATPAFQKKFGYLFKGDYIISAPWQTGLTMGNPIGQGECLWN